MHEGTWHRPFRPTSARGVSPDLGMKNSLRSRFRVRTCRPARYSLGHDCHVSISFTHQLLKACFKAEYSSDELSLDHEALLKPRVSNTCQLHAGNRSLERKLASIRTSHSFLKQVTCSKGVKKLGPLSNLKWISHPRERHGPNSLGALQCFRPV